MTSFKLYQEDYDNTATDCGTVTIMTDATHGDFFLVRDGIPAECEGETVDDPGIRISAEDMEAFCRAALVYIEAFKTGQKGPEDAPKNNNEDIKIYDLGLSVRLFNILKYTFSGVWDGWEKIDIKELTLGDICKHTQRDYMKRRNFGRRSLFELESLLEKYNLELKKR